ncbi:hypothetical protein FSP39_021377 [Pinctada imbricata]|uniref:Uncharacterized protein n=1 Tax=Pinctada imbricata TaxID=66713 RepID=A0AA88YG51_PINIB|nr:hypothetical protein FSP39_021377 [Pinctada imbricata]
MTNMDNDHIPVYRTNYCRQFRKSETEGIQNQDKKETKANKQKPPPHEKKRTPDIRTMKNFAVIAVILQLTYIVSSVPVTEKSTTPAPDVDCVAECDLEKIECGMDCRLVKPQTRQGFLNCSKDCKADYKACMQECRDEAVEQAEEARQDALEAASEATTKSPGGDGQDGTQAHQGNRGANKDKQENKDGSQSTSGGTEETNTGKGDTKDAEKVDIVMNELANVGSENTGILSSAIGGAVKDEGVAVNHGSGSSANSASNGNKAANAGVTPADSNDAAGKSSSTDAGETNENTENETTNDSYQGNNGFTENAEAGWGYDPFYDDSDYGSYEYDDDNSYEDESDD